MARGRMHGGGLCFVLTRVECGCRPRLRGRHTARPLGSSRRQKRRGASLRRRVREAIGGRMAGLGRSVGKPWSGSSVDSLLYTWSPARRAHITRTVAAISSITSLGVIHHLAGPHSTAGSVPHSPLAFMPLLHACHAMPRHQLGHHTTSLTVTMRMSDPNPQIHPKRPHALQKSPPSNTCHQERRPSRRTSS
jgi:hypothetical protein